MKIESRLYNKEIEPGDLIVNKTFPDIQRIVAVLDGKYYLMDTEGRLRKAESIEFIKKNYRLEAKNEDLILKY